MYTKTVIKIEEYEYKLSDILGKGMSAHVYKAKNTKDGKYYALKKLLGSKNTKEREIEILKNLSGHPNILQFFDIKEKNGSLYIITELCNGKSLKDFLEVYEEMNKRKFSEEEVQYIMKQIIEGLKYMHSKNIVHRDLKLDNILLNFDNEEDLENLEILKSTIKLIDFGFSKDAKEITGTLAGTALNQPPELLFLNPNEKDKKKNTWEIDIWEAGTVFYELMVGKSLYDIPEFDDIPKKEMLVKFMEKGEYGPLPQPYSIESALFLDSMLRYSPKERKTSKELSELDFLNNEVKNFHFIQNDSKFNIYKDNNLRLDENKEKFYNFLTPQKTTLKNDSIIKRNVEISEYEFNFDSILGAGISSKVYKAYNHKDGKYYALKKTNYNMSMAETEIKILKKLGDHPNILKFIDVIENENNKYIITEIINGISLRDMLYIFKEDKRKIKVEEIQYIMKQILDGIKYIHSKNIVHRNLKLEKIFLNFDNDIEFQKLNIMNATIKIIGFSFSEEANKVSGSVIGTPINQPPELLMIGKLDKDTNKTSYPVDIWELGTIFYELITGNTIYEDEGYNIIKDKLIEFINQGKYTIVKNLFSIESATFLDGMLRYTPQERKTADELSNHAFLKRKPENFTLINEDIKLSLYNDNTPKIFNKTEIIDFYKREYPSTYPNLIEETKSIYNSEFKGFESDELKSIMSSMNQDFIKLPKILFPLIPEVKDDPSLLDIYSV